MYDFQKVYFQNFISVNLNYYPVSAGINYESLIRIRILRERQRRRIKTEEEAKVVAAIWGTEFLVVRAIFHQNDLKKRDE